MTVIILLVVVMTATTITAVVIVSGRSVRQTSQQLFDSAGTLAEERTTTILESSQLVATTAVTIPDLTVSISHDEVHPVFPFFTEHLRSNDNLYSLYIGRENGDFLQVIQTRGDERILESHNAPDETAFILRTIAGSPDGQEGSRAQRWRFLDEEGTLLAYRDETAPTYDPRDRMWYLDAASEDETILSEVYVFHSLQAPGITAARALPDGTGVLGVDVTLSSLQTFVRNERISPRGGIILADAEERILAFHNNIRRLLPKIDSETASTVPDNLQDTAEREGWLLERRTWLSADDNAWTIIIGAPVSDFLGPYEMIRNRVIILAVVLLLTAIPLILWISRAMTRVLGDLAADASRIKNLDFSSESIARSSIIEFHQLAEGFTDMKSSLFTRTQDLNVSLDRLATIIELNIAISAEQNIDRLTELILEGARTISHADGGSLYILNEENRSLDFAIVLNDTLGFIQGGTSGTDVTLPPVPLYEKSGNPNEHNVVSYAVHHEKTVNIADAYNAGGFDFSGTRRFDETNGYRTESVLTVPLKPRGSDIIGAIQLLNAKDPQTGATVQFSEEIQRFVEALSAGAATALYNRDLIEEQRRLFEAMIQLIAGAIDAKSPYTGGHCARVPEIALMLAGEAERTGQGSLRDFHFSDADDRRAFRIGAWLHDAGKVTTPDFVVDKATKLETMYNRIHEIRTRFEVLLRDARIARHEAVIAGADPVEADARLNETERELHDDFAFIAECNEGGEYMAPERLERLREIARKEWQRFFDDSIGLSWEEKLRYDGTTDTEESSDDTPNKGRLPVTETLLADRKRHIIPRTDDFYRQYEQYRFAMDVPRHLYNLGEVYNLAVERGTLTAEERFKINEHVMQTIVMLDHLPFPTSLKNVPEYAGTHHEALNGTGYPRRLTGEDLSIPARIMAIADIFEALTASDRPYKKAKPLSVAIDILAKFKTDGHIDPELFDLFLTSGVYRRYAERYLKPEQLDEVEISRYVG